MKLVNSQKRLNFLLQFAVIISVFSVLVLCNVCSSTKANENIKKRNLVVSLVPVIDAFEKRKSVLKITELIPKNEMQQLFLNRYKDLAYCRQLFSKNELISTFGPVKYVNQFLRNHHAKIRLIKSPGPTIAFASILNFKVKWHAKGEKISLKLQNARVVPGVLMESGVRYYQVKGNNHHVAKIYTKRSQQEKQKRVRTCFYLTKAPKVFKNEQDLFLFADSIISKKLRIDYSYTGLKFPMVDLDIISNDHWAKNLGFKSKMAKLFKKGKEYNILQARSQNILKMDHKGAIVKSYYAEEAPLEEGERETKYLVIDGPMVVVITKEIRRKKYLIAAYYLIENVFKNPSKDN